MSLPERQYLQNHHEKRKLYFNNCGVTQKWAKTCSRVIVCKYSASFKLRSKKYSLSSISDQNLRNTYKHEIQSKTKPKTKQWISFWTLHVLHHVNQLTNNTSIMKLINIVCSTYRVVFQDYLPSWATFEKRESSYATSVLWLRQTEKKANHTIASMAATRCSSNSSLFVFDKVSPNDYEFEINIPSK